MQMREVCHEGTVNPPNDDDENTSHPSHPEACLNHRGDASLRHDLAFEPSYYKEEEHGKLCRLAAFGNCESISPTRFCLFIACQVLLVMRPAPPSP